MSQKFPFEFHFFLSFRVTINQDMTKFELLPNDKLEKKIDFKISLRQTVIKYYLHLKLVAFKREKVFY